MKGIRPRRSSKEEKGKRKERERALSLFLEQTTDDVLHGDCLFFREVHPGQRRESLSIEEEEEKLIEKIQ